MSSAEGLKLNEADVERLLTRCSNDPNVAIRSEAALELIEVLSGSHEKNESEDEAENEDFNDNNIQWESDSLFCWSSAVRPDGLIICSIFCPFENNESFPNSILFDR